MNAQPNVSCCDVCDLRPGKRWIVACQTETWVCDPCSGINPADYDEIDEARAIECKEDALREADEFTTANCIEWD